MSGGGINSFNDTFKEFICELGKTFPTYTVIQDFEKTIEPELKKDKRVFLEEYMKISKQFIDIIQSENEAKILEKPDDELPFNGVLNIKELLASKYATENNKKAIWQYIKTLNMLGTTVSLIPNEMMDVLDGLATQMASKIESGEIDPNLIIQNAQNLLMSNPMFKDNNLQNLFAGLNTQAATQPQQHKRANKKKKTRK